jgi:ribose/xylose/arabinose/galactoside ABC-type transport system permease subunit
MGLYGAVLTVLGTKGVGAGCGWISGLLVAYITLKQEVITEKIALFASVVTSNISTITPVIATNTDSFWFSC